MKNLHEKPSVFRMYSTGSSAKPPKAQFCHFEEKLRSYPRGPHIILQMGKLRPRQSRDLLRQTPLRSGPSRLRILESGHRHAEGEGCGSILSSNHPLVRSVSDQHPHVPPLWSVPVIPLGQLRRCLLERKNQRPAHPQVPNGPSFRSLRSKTFHALLPMATGGQGRGAHAGGRSLPGPRT